LLRWKEGGKNMSRLIFQAVAVLVLLAVFLSACWQAAPPMTLPGADAGTSIAGGCTYATQEDAQAALGKAVQAGSMVDLDGTRLCTFAAADKTEAGVQIRVSKPIGGVSPQAAVEASRNLTRDNEVLEGLGDAAALLRSPRETRVVVYKGDQEVVVTLQQPEAADADDTAQALAVKVAAHLAQ
jgi:hypothetical protein